MEVVVVLSYILFVVDCERLGEALDTPERLSGYDGGGCKCFNFHVWIVSTWSKFKFLTVLCGAVHIGFMAWIV